MSVLGIIILADCNALIILTDDRLPTPLRPSKAAHPPDKVRTLFKADVKCNNSFVTNKFKYCPSRSETIIKFFYIVVLLNCVVP